MDSLLQQLCNLFARFDAVTQAALFGSRARGDFNERSDYDIAVYGALSDADKARLRCACREELNTLHKIDIAFVADQEEGAFLQNIRKEGVIFYDKARK